MHAWLLIPSGTKQTLRQQCVCCGRVDVVIELLGLQRAADTVVGDAMLRGVSGGERKRVTSAGAAYGIVFSSLPLHMD
jgi:ABC-type multidrug transport system ATPase subunit